MPLRRQGGRWYGNEGPGYSRPGAPFRGGKRVAGPLVPTRRVPASHTGGADTPSVEDPTVLEVRRYTAEAAARRAREDRESYPGSRQAGYGSPGTVPGGTKPGLRYPLVGDGSPKPGTKYPLVGDKPGTKVTGNTATAGTSRTTPAPTGGRRSSGAPATPPPAAPPPTTTGKGPGKGGDKKKGRGKVKTTQRGRADLSMGVDPTKGAPEDPMNKAAMAEFDRQQKIVQDAYAAQQRDLAAFREWMTQNQTNAQTSLQGALSSSDTAANQAAAAAAARMKQYVDAARADPMASESGLDKVLEGGAILQNPEAAAIAQAQAQNASLLKYNDAQRGIGNAQLANMQGMSMGQQIAGLNEITGKKAEYLAAAQQTAAQRQAEANKLSLDRDIFDWTKKYQGGQLGIDKFRAGTERKAADAAARLADIKANVDATIRDGRLNLDTFKANTERMKAQGLISNNQQKQLLAYAETEQKLNIQRATTAETMMQNMLKRYGKDISGNPVATSFLAPNVPEGDKRKLIRQYITQLSTVLPNMTPAQAAAIMAPYLQGAAQDPAFQKLIAARWRKAK